MPTLLDDPLGAVRRLLLALLAFGLAGTAVELALLEHYEDARQLVPFGVVAVTFVALTVFAWTGRAKAVRIFRASMVLLMVAGVAGVALHYLGNREFQRDMDPAATEWQLFVKIIRAKAPPALAPGVLVQFGLLGLVATFRHPALQRPNTLTEGASS